MIPQIREGEVKALGKILRDPSYPRDLRMTAFRDLVASTPLGVVQHYASRLVAFRHDTGGCYLPELMVD